MSKPQPAKAPERIVLEGRYTRLEPIAARHAAGLFAATGGEGAEARYRWLPSYPPASLADLGAWIETAIDRDDPLTFAVVDKATDQAVGRQALMRFAPADGSIEIGGVLWGRGCAGTKLATESLYLFARYVFDERGYRRFEWKCNNLNEPSKRAAKRFGFSYEGLFRQHMIVKGENRDTAWFSMLDGEWPRIKAGLERWLDPGNFDADGVQREKLGFA